MTTATSPAAYTTLKTVSVRVKTATGDYYQAKGLFDTGSERSYLSTALRKVLKPKKLSEEYLRFATFGSSSGGSRKLATIYEVELMDNQNQAHPVRLAEVKDIAPPIFQYKVPDLSLPPFKGLKFADVYDTDCYVTLEFLIGADLYWSFLQEDDAVRSGNLVAMNSPFGYVLSGLSNIL